MGKYIVAFRASRANPKIDPDTGEKVSCIRVSGLLTALVIQQVYHDAVKIIPHKNYGRHAYIHITDNRIPLCKDDRERYLLFEVGEAQLQRMAKTLKQWQEADGVWLWRDNAWWGFPCRGDDFWKSGKWGPQVAPEQSAGLALSPGR